MKRFRFPFFPSPSSVSRLAVAAVVALAALHATARGALDEAKEAVGRMKARQVEMEKILVDKMAGERNDGLLEPMSNPPAEAAALIEQENQDREAVYADIAKATGIPAPDVKRRRADDLRERLIPGVWRMVPADDEKWEWSLGEPEKRIPPRLLTRPGASLHTAPDGDVSVSGIENFTMYEVVGQTEGAGGALWYQVAEKGGSPSGWIREASALEWYQALVMKFTTPLDRNRVLFFDDKEELRRLAEMPRDERGTEVSRIIGTAEAGGDPGRSVVALEPVFDARTQEVPVIIPILDHEVITLDGVRETRLLRLAAATRSEEAAGTRGATSAAPARDPEIDIVFVMDTTSSMGAYLEKTKEAVAEFAASAGGSNPTIRFGVVAYRDGDPAFRSQMEYTAKSFTPALVGAAELAEVLAEVKALPRDPGDPIPEDVFTGVDEAVRSSWRNAPGDGLRFVILVGDASGNDPYTASGTRSPGNQSGLDGAGIREILDRERINLMAVHIREPKYRSDHVKAETDFSILARNPVDLGGRGTTYAPVDFRPESFAVDIRHPFKDILDFLTMERDAFKAEAEVAQARSGQPAIERMFAGLLANAYAEWVVGQNRVPLDRDFKGWVIPDDLADPTRRAMDRYLMLKRPELENLKRRLDAVLEAANESSQTAGDFFERIQTIPGNAIRNPSANQFGEVFDFPDLIKNLPYLSRILGMKRGDWESMGEGQKTEYINGWRGMSGYYGRLLQDRDSWDRLSPGGEEFVMISLDMLP